MPHARIIFMGTPEFAVPSLEALVEKGYPIAAVITQPDRPQGRGRTDAPPPVKRCALSHGLPVLQPERVRDGEFLAVLRDIAPDLIVVAAFGQILPREMLEIPPLGCINVHPSLLPKFRGAAPINWAIIRGEEVTGVTIMEMAEGVDSGAIIHQEETPIAPAETFGQLHDRLAALGSTLLLRSVALLEEGEARPVPQDHAMATHAPRLKKEDGLIRWDRQVREIVDLIRGLSPQPCAYTFLAGKMLKVFAASGREVPVGEQPGTVLLPPSPEGLAVAAANGCVLLRDVQLENKKRMPVHEFLRGYRFAPETVLA
jgi:methionyl-tRNA formyltransferase